MNLVEVRFLSTIQHSSPVLCSIALVLYCLPYISYNYTQFMMLWSGVVWSHSQIWIPVTMCKVNGQQIITSSLLLMKGKIWLTKWRGCYLYDLQLYCITYIFPVNLHFLLCSCTGSYRLLPNLRSSVSNLKCNWCLASSWTYIQKLSTLEAVNSASLRQKVWSLVCNCRIHTLMWGGWVFNFPGRGGRGIPKDLPLQILIIFCLSCPGDSGEALLSLHTLEQLAYLQAPKYYCN